MALTNVSSALRTAVVAVDDSATLVCPAKTVRKSVTVRNLDDTNVVYIGAAGVTDATGFPLQPGETDALGESFRFDDFNGDIYAVCATSASADVAVIEVG